MTARIQLEKVVGREQKELRQMVEGVLDYQLKLLHHYDHERYRLQQRFDTRYRRYLQDKTNED